MLYEEINKKNLLIDELNDKLQQKDNLIKLTNNKVQLL